MLVNAGKFCKLFMQLIFHTVHVIQIIPIKHWKKVIGSRVAYCIVLVELVCLGFGPRKLLLNGLNRQVALVPCLLLEPRDHFRQLQVGFKSAD